MFNLMASLAVGMAAMIQGWFGGNHDFNGTTTFQDSNRQHGPQQEQHGLRDEQNGDMMHGGNTTDGATSTEDRMGDHTGDHMGDKKGGPRFAGIVTAINGTTLIVSIGGGQGQASSSEKVGTLTVDASSARILKGGTSASSTASISNIAVGDRVMIAGKVTSMNISLKANVVVDGIPQGRPEQK